MSANLKAALTFLEALTGKNDPPVTLSTFTDRKPQPKPDPLARIFHGRITSLDPYLTALNKRGAGIFYSLNETDLAGRRTENIIRIQAIPQDDDTGHGWAHFLIEPNAVIETSPGRCQRLFFTDSKKLSEYDGVLARLISDHGHDPEATGIARVYRLPGYYHMKNPDRPFLVHTVSAISPVRYSWDTIKKIFPPVPTPRRHSAPPYHKQANPRPIESIGRIYAAIQHIDADGYTDWLRVGMALHYESGGSAEGLRLWDDWSQRSYKYEPGDCDTKWATFGRRKIRT